MADHDKPPAYGGPPPQHPQQAYQGYGSPPPPGGPGGYGTPPPGQYYSPGPEMNYGHQQGPYPPPGQYPPGQYPPQGPYPPQGQYGQQYPPQGGYYQDNRGGGSGGGIMAGLLGARGSNLNGATLRYKSQDTPKTEILRPIVTSNVRISITSNGMMAGEKETWYEVYGDIWPGHDAVLRNAWHGVGRYTTDDDDSPPVVKLAKTRVGRGEADIALFSSS
ncbi:hypothetical protein CFIO01_05394 [Colletotrichum fioriniae PJ7]|uniref:Uncharacterized protein n=1 Tax=Colletotrichum fioriniae PJ7 TaxID=1445577 RepID=A0A010Q8V9_9PEZI|nr:hypothetical protein CFIO01_05394 [Colletotrichum fioriniae PJ7]